jgi:hypothetical protein
MDLILVVTMVASPFVDINANSKVMCFRSTYNKYYTDTIRRTLSCLLRYLRHPF